MPQMVRIDPAAHAALSEIARARRLSLTEALTRAIATFRRETLIQQMSDDYAELRADPQAWSEERAERASWDRANLDGLEREPPYPLPAEEPSRGPAKSTVGGRARRR